MMRADAFVSFKSADLCTRARVCVCVFATAQSECMLVKNAFNTLRALQRNVSYLLVLIDSNIMNKGSSVCLDLFLYSIFYLYFVSFFLHLCIRFNCISTSYTLKFIFSYSLCFLSTFSLSGFRCRFQAHIFCLSAQIRVFSSLASFFFYLSREK